MAVRMSHPKHGLTNAVGAEIAWNIANGWKIDTLEKKAEPQETKPDAGSTTVAVQQAPADSAHIYMKRRPGRPKKVDSV